MTRPAPPDQLTSCAGKARFDTQRLAGQVSARRTRNGRRDQAYKCVHCGGWHLGLAIRHRERKQQLAHGGLR
jgi:hypothetical protein